VCAYVCVCCADWDPFILLNDHTDPQDLTNTSTRDALLSSLLNTLLFPTFLMLLRYVCFVKRLV
jgi:hypothetical protein